MRSAARALLVYLHGFNSSPASFKSTLLKQALQSRGLGECFRCPALPHRPAQAVATIEQALTDVDARELTLVGSSLGGYYATYLVEKYGCKAVLLNPAIMPQQDLRAYLGPQRNLYTGEEYLLTETHLSELAALAVPRLAHPERYFLITETGDEIIDYRAGVMRYVGAKQLVIEGGDHAMRDFAKYVDMVLQWSGLGAATSA